MKSFIQPFRKHSKPTCWLLILLVLSSCYSYKPLSKNKEDVRAVISTLQKGDEILGRLDNGKKFDGKFNFSDQENIYLGNEKGVASRTVPITQIAELKLGKKSPGKTFLVVIVGIAVFIGLLSKMGGPSGGAGLYSGGI